MQKANEKTLFINPWAYKLSEVARDVNDAHGSFDTVHTLMKRAHEIDSNALGIGFVREKSINLYQYFTGVTGNIINPEIMKKKIENLYHDAHKEKDNKTARILGEHLAVLFPNDMKWKKISSGEKDRFLQEIEDPEDRFFSVIDRMNELDEEGNIEEQRLWLNEFWKSLKQSGNWQHAVEGVEKTIELEGIHSQKTSDAVFSLADIKKYDLFEKALNIYAKYDGVGEAFENSLFKDKIIEGSNGNHDIEFYESIINVFEENGFDTYDVKQAAAQNCAFITGLEKTDPAISKRELKKLQIKAADRAQELIHELLNADTKDHRNYNMLARVFNNMQERNISPDPVRDKILQGWAYDEAFYKNPKNEMYFKSYFKYLKYKGDFKEALKVINTFMYEKYEAQNETVPEEFRKRRLDMLQNIHIQKRWYQEQGAKILDPIKPDPL